MRKYLLERADRPGFWQSVTGSREGEEALIDTARREVAEETGLVAGPPALSDWGVTNRFEIYAHWRHRYAPGVTTIRNTCLVWLVPGRGRCAWPRESIWRGAGCHGIRRPGRCSLPRTPKLCGAFPRGCLCVMDPLHVVTFNMHKGLSPMNRHVRLEEIARALAVQEPDLVFLQEVQGKNQLRALQHAEWSPLPQHHFLARHLDFRGVYGMNASYGHGHHGNAILTRSPD